MNIKELNEKIEMVETTIKSDLINNAYLSKKTGLSNTFFSLIKNGNKDIRACSVKNFIKILEVLDKEYNEKEEELKC